MIPENWAKSREKPTCYTCGCIEFSPEGFCKGCGEALVVWRSTYTTVRTITALEKWKERLPQDYVDRCFLCGTRAEMEWSDFHPTGLAEEMAGRLLLNRPETKKLFQAMWGSEEAAKDAEEMYLFTLACLADTDENVLFDIQINPKYDEVAERNPKLSLSFCRRCGEAALESPKRKKPEAASSVQIADTRASAAVERGENPKITPKAPEPPEEDWEESTQREDEGGNWEEAAEEDDW